MLLPLLSLGQESFITHKVEPKESLTSIGRKYNINGRELARYNNLDYDRGIQIGQTLRIPVRGDFNTGGAGNPIYHTVLPKETLYSISLKYNKIPIETLKRWNNLQSDALQEGMRLIVSYSEASSSIPASSIPVTASQPAPKAAPKVRRLFSRQQQFPPHSYRKPRVPLREVFSNPCLRLLRAIN